LNYYFLIEMELFLIELDFNFRNIYRHTLKKFKSKSVEKKPFIRIIITQTAS
jgi:hypothetical protein